MIIRTSLGLCVECIDDREGLADGKCACSVDMPVCDECGCGPLNDGENLCGQHLRLDKCVGGGFR